jgi:hypothetical protein
MPPSRPNCCEPVSTKRPICGRAVGHTQQVGQQRRRSLYLVEDGAVHVAGQEAARVGKRQLARVGVFQVDVRQRGEGAARQRGLARLPRAGDRQHRKALRQAQQRGLGIAGHDGGQTHEAGYFKVET